MGGIGLILMGDSAVLVGHATAPRDIRVAAPSAPVEADGDRQSPIRLRPPEDAPSRQQGAPRRKRALPLRVQIPSIGVDSSLVRLGLTPERELEVPTDFDLAGWYQRGPTPGAPGAAVIVGHVDSLSGPAVFFELDQLEADDEILIDRNDGSRVTFVVEWSARYPKTQFPTGLVYQDTPGATLRLVTCGGEFDSASGHYLDNIVVFARLVDDGGDASTPVRAPNQPSAS